MKGAGPRLGVVDLLEQFRESGQRSRPAYSREHFHLPEAMLMRRLGWVSGGTGTRSTLPSADAPECPVLRIHERISRVSLTRRS